MTPQHSQSIHVVYANRHDCGSLANALSYTLPVIGWTNTTLRAHGEIPWEGYSRPVVIVALIGPDSKQTPWIAGLGQDLERTVLIGGRPAIGSLAWAASSGALSVLCADLPFKALLDQLDRLIWAFLSNEIVFPEPGLASALLAREHEARQIDTLTDRECEVLGSLLIGATPAEIASVNRLSVSTVRNHVNRVFQKLEVSSVQRACAVVLRSSCDPRLEVWVRYLADFRHHERVPLFEQYR